MASRVSMAETGQTHTKPSASKFSLAQQSAAALVDQCFKRDLGHSPRLWLVYDARTHTGLLLALGQVRPRKKRWQGLSAILGVAEVTPTAQFLNAVAARGPEALRFTGVHVVLAGH